MDSRIPGEGSIRGEILIDVKLIEQISIQLLAVMWVLLGFYRLAYIPDVSPRLVTAKIEESKRCVLTVPLRGTKRKEKHRSAYGDTADTSNMESEDPSSKSNSPPPPTQSRRICGNCDRPQAVCLCHVIPTTPITTNTRILIIHHPHEAHHKLNTARLLTKSVRHVTTHLSRKLLHSHLTDQSPSATIYLFPPSPTTPAVTLSDLKQTLNNNDNVLLIAFDATWKHAKEMVKASQGVLESVGAIRACLDVDEGLAGGSIYDDELVLRKEPFKGCVSTLEAAARVLGAIEDKGDDIERVLIGVLREMVRLQAGFLKPVKPRPKLLKKSKQNEMKTLLE